MRRLNCACGQRVYFDNTGCVVCGRALGFDPAELAMRTLESDGDAYVSVDATGAPDGAGRFRVCGNRITYDNCNWLIPAGTHARFCVSCSLNDVIPNLDRPGNLGLWTKIEQAKRRLLYTLLELDLPITASDGSPGLRFQFLEDQSRNPDVLEQVVVTGHLQGLVTINLAEADDSTRHAYRELMQERYRTVLGHLRHEVGHHYFGLLASDPADLAECRALFGDERTGYAAALDAHYAAGPKWNWMEQHVSAYASAHPMEDFAETFAHYLLIVDGLETASGVGLESAGGQGGWIDRWVDLSIAVNELNRGMGVDDAYPFVLSATVIDKLEVIDRLVRRRA